MTTLSETLRSARSMRGVSLRDVESATCGAVSNGYLSQLEHGRVTRPSLPVLETLANFYGLGYRYLCELAGHPLPGDGAAPADPMVDGPLVQALLQLTDAEREQVADYISFLRFRRRARDITDQGWDD